MQAVVYKSNKNFVNLSKSLIHFLITQTDLLLRFILLAQNKWQFLKILLFYWWSLTDALFYLQIIKQLIYWSYDHKFSPLSFTEHHLHESGISTAYCVPINKLTYLVPFSITDNENKQSALVRYLAQECTFLPKASKLQLNKTFQSSWSNGSATQTGASIQTHSIQPANLDANNKLTC